METVITDSCNSDPLKTVSKQILEEEEYLAEHVNVIKS